MGQSDETAYVFLDPDGSVALGLLVIVHAKTGVIYASQCAGIATDVREAEGFLVPVAVSDPATTERRNIDHALLTFFADKFRGSPPPYSGEWTPHLLAELDALVACIVFWKTRRASTGERGHLALDRSRLADLTEAWIPVITPYGPGTLVTANSD